MSQPLRRPPGDVVVDRGDNPVFIDQRLSFAVPRTGEIMSGTVMRWRRDPRCPSGIGWLDLLGDDGLERSARPTQCFKLAEKIDDA